MLIGTKLLVNDKREVAIVREEDGPYLPVGIASILFYVVSISTWHNLWFPIQLLFL